MVRNGTCEISGVLQVLSHPGELSILPNIFNGANTVKHTLFGVLSWKEGVAAKMMY